MGGDEAWRRRGLPPATIRVVGHQWWCEVEYLGRPRTSTTCTRRRDPHAGRPAGRHRARTRDVIHSFWVPKLHGKVDLIPGQTTASGSRPTSRASTEANAPSTAARSTRTWSCVVVAQQPDEFEAWLAQRSASRRRRRRAAERARARRLPGARLRAVPYDPRHRRARARSAPTSRTSAAAGARGQHAAEHHGQSGGVGHACAVAEAARRCPTSRRSRGADLRALVAYLQSLR